MTFGGKKATTLLFIGDIIVFICALWLTLAARALSFEIFDRFTAQLALYLPVFLVWLLVFYMAGLYSKHVILFKAELWGVIFRTQILNIVLAALYFFLLPGLGITPKTTLVLYLFISLAGIFAWRLWLFPRLTKPASRSRAVLIGEGPEIEELFKEVNSNGRYQVQFLMKVTPAELSTSFSEYATEFQRLAASLLVVDIENEALRPLLPQIYELAFVSPTYQLVNFYGMYEEVFDRVPLSLLQYDWFLNNVSTTASNFYEIGKRIIDIIGGLAMALVMLVAIPFVYVALRSEGAGPLFIKQDRWGKNGSHILAYKFRSMRYSDSGAWMGKRVKEEKRGKEVGEDIGEQKNYVTRVGAVLRTTSLDEFPQCINVLRGELSLIGPRNDIRPLGVTLSEAIPYYRIRYIVKPGITGWAQINQQYEPGNISPQSIEETKMRLAYDFYYIKHRSFALDVVIALKTFKRMLFRVSSL